MTETVCAVRTAADDGRTFMSTVERTDRFDRGMNALKSLNAEAAERVREALKDISPDMARFIVEFAYGDVYSRPGLDSRSRQAATVAALTALGNAESQLKFHIAGGLNAGLSPDEIVEIMYVTTVFAGFPRGLNGIEAAREVFKERGVGVSVSSDHGVDSHTRRELGLLAMARTSKGAGKRVTESLSDIAPEMAGFIIDFCYGEIFSRKGLDPRLKEIAMIAVCVALGAMEPQMKVHIRAALNVGCTAEEIVELMNHMAVYAGFPAALNGLTSAGEVFGEAGIGPKK
jgi:4-carboxymuconolactone decarboxylase